jgi:hypothetical protein
MTASLIKWHLSHDNQIKLSRFCEKHKLQSDCTVYPQKGVFYLKFHFDNGGWIQAELLMGTKEKSYSVADHFQVIDYSLGAV